MLVFGTLGRYISLQFAKSILLVLATLFGLIYVLDFVELMRRAGDTEGATAGLMARLAFLRVPSISEQLLPFAVLFGSMAALMQLSRKLELVVARAAGISAWQFLQAGVGVAALFGLVAVTIYNPFAASMKQQAAAIEARVFARRLAEPGKEVWIRQTGADGTAIVRAEAAVGGTTTLQGVTVFTFRGRDVFQERIEAREASLRPGYWELKGARVVTADEAPVSYDTYLVASHLEPSQVRQTFTSADSVSFWDMKETIVQTERAGLDATPYRLQYSMLLARPLLLIAMVLVAASVSLRFFRFGGIAKMVVGGVAAGFMLYVATELMEDLGKSGLVGPAIAAWFPAVVGSLLGSLALLYQEDG
jgi:lipopolysaccharide export system permease protein